MGGEGPNVMSGQVRTSPGYLMRSICSVRREMLRFLRVAVVIIHRLYASRIGTNRSGGAPFMEKCSGTQHGLRNIVMETYILFLLKLQVS
jgi:hypothetical protein